MTNSIDEILNADVIFVMGSNTTENHPVIGAKMRQALRRGAKLIVAEPRKIDLAKEADVFLQLKPGTNIALLNGMMHVILTEGLQNETFIGERTENFEELRKVVEKYPPEIVAEICGVEKQDIIKAARLYGKAKKAGLFYCMGITQHSTGVENVMSVSNLALLCGQIGRESTGVNPLRGQNNVQGACDMGALPDVFPGYQKVNNIDVLNKFEKAWGISLPSTPGLTVPEMMKKAGNGDFKLLYIMGENPMVSDPDTNHVKHALENLEFLVVQDIFLTETAELADVVLPAASFAEKDGTFTNTERRVQRVRKAVKPVGEAKPDWVILMDIINRFGYDQIYSHPVEIMDEIRTLTPSYGGITYERIDHEGIQWPCPTLDHKGTPVLHAGTFSRGKGLFRGIEHQMPSEAADEDFPFILTTGRILYHYHTRTMTGRVEGLNQIAPESYIQIHPLTAEKLGVGDGEIVVVSSRRGRIQTKVAVTDVVTENVVFMPFHFAKGAANILTNGELDPVSKTPELKVCAVAIKKIRD